MRAVLSPAVVGIVGVALIVVTGLIKGIDGVLAMSGLSVIGAIAGYGVGKYRRKD